jgi:hypothetical protein
LESGNRETIEMAAEATFQMDESAGFSQTFYVTDLFKLTDF